MSEPTITPATDAEMDRMQGIIGMDFPVDAILSIFARYRQDRARIAELEAESDTLKDELMNRGTDLIRLTSERVGLRARVQELEAIAKSDDGAGGEGMKLVTENATLKARVKALEEALTRLGSMEAFDVGTVHVPEEVIMRVDYARAILARKEPPDA